MGAFNFEGRIYKTPFDLQVGAFNLEGRVDKTLSIFKWELPAWGVQLAGSLPTVGGRLEGSLPTEGGRLGRKSVI